MRRRRAILGAACVLGTMVLPPASRADVPAIVGWWSSASVANPAPVGGSTISLAAEPDIPSGGFLVQGGTSFSSPSAFAALAYYAADGVSVTRLDLALATANTAGVTKLEACPLKSTTFSAADGGPVSSAPAYDCTSPVPGTLSSDGSTYSFAVGPLVQHGSLAVAILPLSLTDRAVFAAPDSKSIVTSGTPTDASAVGVPTQFPSAEPSASPSAAAPSTSPTTRSVPAAVSNPVTPYTPTSAAPAGTSTGTTTGASAPVDTSAAAADTSAVAPATTVDTGAGTDDTTTASDAIDTAAQDTTPLPAAAEASAQPTSQAAAASVTPLASHGNTGLVLLLLLALLVVAVLWAVAARSATVTDTDPTS